MFWNASAMKGYHVAATDGDVGHVADILIDDVAWTVRWLVVHTGSWLNERAVCLPAWALAPPDPRDHRLAVRLSRGQIESSPEIDGDRRLSLEREALIGEHYASFNLMEAGAAPGTTATLARPAPVTVERSQDLVSLNALTDATVEALDGEIGHVESLILDPETWAIRYFVVHTGLWWADKKVLIPPDAVVRIDDIRCSIDLNVDRAKVRGSPDYVEAETVDGAFDELFHIYYGIKWMKK